MGSSAVELIGLCEEPCRDEAMTMALEHWPGALTLVLPSTAPVVARLNPGGSSLGLRIPNSSLTRSLLSRTGSLATTSANRSGEPSCTSAAEAAVVFPDLPQLGPQPWPGPSGQASTVLAWDGPGRWRVLRRGAVMPKGCQDR
jgi:L-threonylcarbamoyladenylate synthase